MTSIGPISRRTALSMAGAAGVGALLGDRGKGTKVRPSGVGANTDETIDLQQLVDDAVASGEDIVTLPPGRLLMASAPVTLSGVQNLTIRGSGRESTVIVNGFSSGTFAVSGSSNITFRDFTIDYDPLPFTQGTITDIVPVGENTEVNFETHPGYPPLTDAILAGAYLNSFFDGQTRQIKKRTDFFRNHLVSRIDGTHGKVTLGPVPWVAELNEGDLLVVKASFGGCMSVVRSNSVAVEDVTIHCAGAVGVFGSCVQGTNSLHGMSIVPGSPPAGASHPRLVSSNADGVQWKSSPGSFSVDDCEFSYTGDDCMNVTDWGFPIVNLDDPSEPWTATHYPHDYVSDGVAEILAPGDLIQALAYGNNRLIDAVTMASVTHEGLQPVPALVAQRYPPFRTLTTAPTLRVKLSAPLDSAVSVGDLVTIPALSPTWSVTNSYFHDTRGRGMLCTMSNGTIENNLFERTEWSAIWVLGPMHPVGGWTSNLLIQENSINDVTYRYQISRPESTVAGAINITQGNPPGDQTPYLPFAAGFTNVDVKNNTIDGSDIAGIFVNGVSGTEIVGNTIRNSNLRGGEDVATSRSLTAAYAMTVMNSDNVTLAANTVTDLGPFALGTVKDLGTYPPP